MVIIHTSEVVIASEMDVIKARVSGKKIAVEAGFGEIGVAETEIVISELGTNIVKHADSHGVIIFRTVKEGGVRGIEIIACDQGPGMKDKDALLTGGKSSTGTLGIGLSGVRRLTDELDLKDGEHGGSIISTRKWIKGDFRSKVHCSVLSKPKLGEMVSGDTYFFKYLPSYTDRTTESWNFRNQDKGEVSIVIVRTMRGKYGLIVDRLKKNMEVAVKPPPAALAGIDIISGVTIMGDGKVFLVLNPENLL
ncbi:MAG: hypothetical protein GY749_14710 [Desulfobacteraceae bacterium]|nr:hypothetical protein [Desulfobacteraceae bacterium]